MHFGLGTEHGVKPGLELQVYNPRGKSVGLARVEGGRPAGRHRRGDHRPGDQAGVCGEPGNLRTEASGNCLLRTIIKNILAVLFGISRISLVLLEGLLQIFQPIAYRVRGNKIELP